MQIENKIWIMKGGKPYLGNGRITLLENIELTGSISRAAQNLDMSYKKAWELVKSMNYGSDKPLVDKVTGGKNGGGSVLTKQGKKVIKEFRRIERRSRKYLDNELRRSKMMQL